MRMSDLTLPSRHLICQTTNNASQDKEHKKNLIRQTKSAKQSSDLGLYFINKTDKRKKKKDYKNCHFALNKQTLVSHKRFCLISESKDGIKDDYQRHSGA